MFLLKKLDSKTRKDWKLSLGFQTEYPTFEEFETFLKDRIFALEAFTAKNDESASKNSGGINLKSHHTISES